MQPALLPAHNCRPACTLPPRASVGQKVGQGGSADRPVGRHTAPARKAPRRRRHHPGGPLCRQSALLCAALPPASAHHPGHANDETCVRKELYDPAHARRRALLCSSPDDSPVSGDATCSTIQRRPQLARLSRRARARHSTHHAKTTSKGNFSASNRMRQRCLYDLPGQGLLALGLL